MNPISLDSNELVTYPLNFAGERLTIQNFAADRLINDNLRIHGVWEPWQLTLMQRIIGPEFNCVDIGANIGINAMYMARRCPQGRVVAFEPFDAIFRVLQKNIESNRLTNVTAINKGISDAGRTLHMVTNVGMVGGAHIEESTVAVEGHVGGDFRFARLEDELSAQGIDQIDFMKIDVEGHELQVLAGAGKYLENPDLQLVIEFNPAQLRRAISNTSPFPDRLLFGLVKSHFRHIFYMNRDNSLTELKDYHALRRLLLGGYFVDDLYCANRILPELNDLIREREPISPSIRVTREKVGDISVTSYNRDLDGWAMGNEFHPSTMCLTVSGPVSRQLTLKLGRIYSQHLHLQGYTAWPVWALVGQTGLTFDLLDAPAQFSVETGPEPLNITIQSEHQTPAAKYFGNPADTRHIGVQVAFSAD